ncbi:phosphoprotein [Strawberry virus 2]|nr:phosphoprotein [Strawberry virus 2]
MEHDDSSFDDLDTSLLRSPNSYPSPDHDNLSHDDVESYKHIPTSSAEASSNAKQSSSVDPKDVMELLDDAAACQGVAVSAVMGNTAVALANRYGLEASSMEWFIAGVTFANNQMISEKMAQLIKDMQVEMRNLQGVTGTVKSNSEEFMSKLRANKNEITAEITKTKDTVVSALQEMRYPNSCTAERAAVMSVPLPKEKKSTLVPPQPINEALLADALKKPVTTKTPEEMLIRKQEDFLLTIGFELEDVEKIPRGCLDTVLDKDMLSLDMDLASDQDIEEITDLVLTKLVELGVSL